MGTAVRTAKTSPDSWDAFCDVDAYVDEVLAELAAMAADGTRPTCSGPKPPLTVVPNAIYAPKLHEAGASIPSLGWRRNCLAEGLGFICVDPLLMIELCDTLRVYHRHPGEVTHERCGQTGRGGLGGASG